MSNRSNRCGHLDSLAGEINQGIVSLETILTSTFMQLITVILPFITHQPAVMAFEYKLAGPSTIVHLNIIVDQMTEPLLYLLPNQLDKSMIGHRIRLQHLTMIRDG